MSGIRGVPPGRAGRMWLLRRLHTAERGADLLDRKLRILRGEQQRFRLLTERTRAEWETRYRDAATWLTRAAMLGGQRAIRLADEVEPAAVRVTWSGAMGVRYPSDATCLTPAAPVTTATPGNTALVQAVRTHRLALQAAVQHAAAEAALRTVDAEMETTRRRLQAIEDRWIPRLTEALHDVELALEELEHGEGVRLRWAAGREAAREEAGR